MGEAKEQTLSKLKVGDRCCCWINRKDSEAFLAAQTVKSITPSGRIRTSHGEWNADGSLRGSAGVFHGMGALEPMTEKHEATICRQIWLKRIRKTDWSAQSGELLSKIVGLLNTGGVGNG